MESPLVSVIVPTKNSSQFLGECLASIRNQTYRNIEIVVVDNHSEDHTREIASQFTSLVFLHGPERSAQVNFGVSKATGQYVYRVDSDFVLEPQVIEQCLAKIEEYFDAVVVHNSPDPTISWIAKIRKFEVDMYKYDITHSSARFVRKEAYQSIGGLNEKITAGEDYDFQNRLNRAGFRTGFIEAEALHRGEPTSFWKHMVKYYDYGRDFIVYRQENREEAKQQLAFGRKVYLKHWKKFLQRPFMAVAFLTYNLFKFGSGGFGYLRKREG